MWNHPDVAMHVGFIIVAGVLLIIAENIFITIVALALIAYSAIHMSFHHQFEKLHSKRR